MTTEAEPKDLIMRLTNIDELQAQSKDKEIVNLKHSIPEGNSLFMKKYLWDLIPASLLIKTGQFAMMRLFMRWFATDFLSTCTSWMNLLESVPTLTTF